MSAPRRVAGRWLVACLLCLGFWQLGSGAYIPAKAWLAQELMQRAWLRAGKDVERAVPWPWADTWPVARLRSKSRQVDLIVLAGGSGRTLAFGPGHLSASAMPGEIGNTVIAGHRDTHFKFLRTVEKGELLSVESTKGQKHLYEVIGADVVDSRKGSLLLDTDVAMLTLVTCYPFEAYESGGPLRYVVTAKRVF
ncbi:MAG: class GN sortase [Gammaproteobacteria bacterium]|nr:class GN sortase [Gammaproteobacteria bacterium]NNL50805.1 class GN sortase [Woeseiaceae bacterium]